MEHPERIIQPSAETTNTTGSRTQPDPATPTSAPPQEICYQRTTAKNAGGYAQELPS